MKIETAKGVKKIRKAPPTIDAFNMIIDANVSD